MVPLALPESPWATAWAVPAPTGYRRRSARGAARAVPPRERLSWRCGAASRGVGAGAVRSAVRARPPGGCPGRAPGSPARPRRGGEDMSTDGSSVAQAARELAGRLRAVASGGRQGPGAARHGPAGRGPWPGRAGTPGPGEDAGRDGARGPGTGLPAASQGAPGAPPGEGAAAAAGQAAAAPGQAAAAPGEKAGEHHGRPWLAADGAAGLGVPGLLLRAATWSLCLLLVAAVAYLAFRVADALRLLVLPMIAALLLTALLQPLTARLRRIGMPALAATWSTLLVAIAVLAGLGMLIANRVQADYPRLVAEVQRTVREVQLYLAGPPFRLNNARLEELSGKLLSYLASHKGLVAGTVLTGGRYFLEVLTGLILTVFITFFLLKDGHRIWSWLISGFRPPSRERVSRAGDAGWQALVGYVRGTTAVAAIHALFIGLALWLLGVPLLVPLVILVFLAAYVPLIGILVVGALAITVTLATRGWVAALILLVVFLAENQLESHLLQPLVVGRIVRLHPLAIIVALAVGGIVAGIPGAIVAVPVAAVATYALPHLRGDGEAGSQRAPDGPGPGMAPGPAGQAGERGPGPAAGRPGAGAAGAPGDHLGGTPPAARPEPARPEPARQRERPGGERAQAGQHGARAEPVPGRRR